MPIQERQMNATAGKFHKKDFNIGKTYNNLFLIYIGRIS